MTAPSVIRGDRRAHQLHELSHQHRRVAGQRHHVQLVELVQEGVRDGVRHVRIAQRVDQRGQHVGHRHQRDAIVAAGLLVLRHDRGDAA